MSTTYYNAINWNEIEDVVDKSTWEKLTEQFWLDTRIPISNDLDDWRSLSQKERDLVGKVFGGLTLLDTVQSESGMSQLKKDVRTPHEEAVLNNIEFMECYTSEHELLTPQGWKRICDIKKGDIVLAYDNDKDKTLFQPVLTTSKHIPDYILKIGNTRNHIRVSPGHTMLYEEADKKTSTANMERSFISKTIRADEINNLPKTFAYRIPIARDFMGDVKSDLTAWDRFLIAFQADGSINNRESKRIEKYKRGSGKLVSDTFSVRFSFSKESKIKRLRQLCDTLKIKGIRLVELKDGKSTNRKNFSVYIPFELVKNVDMSDKQLTNWFCLSDFDNKKAKDFIEEISLWDSHIRKSKDGKATYINYYSKNETDVDFTNAVAVLAGYTCRKEKRIDNRKPTFSDVYSLRILLHSQKNLSLQSLTVKKEDPEMVYGIEVPSHYLLVRNGDSTMISGNCVHAKSYSSIFSTLNTKSEIEEIFAWTNSNPYLQTKAKIVNEIYKNGTPLQKKIASVFLESFLFYSGFFTPLYYLGNNKLPNVAEIIKLIIRDESVHGTYIGYKFQLGFNELSDAEQSKLRDWMYDLLFELYENEEAYTKELYDDIGWTDEVITFLRYNANKALMNLGQDPLFPDTANDVNPIVMNGISTGTSNHDFFSQVGNGYLLGKVEPMLDSDYLIGT